MASRGWSRSCPFRALDRPRCWSTSAALRDPREGWRVPYPLRDILLVVLCATLCGMDDVVEVELWGGARLQFLRRVLPFRRGIPSHDMLDDVMSDIDADLFRLCFAD